MMQVVEYFHPKAPRLDQWKQLTLLETLKQP